MWVSFRMVIKGQSAGIMMNVAESVPSCMLEEDMHRRSLDESL